jgi:hypothetical protein
LSEECPDQGDCVERAGRNQGTFLSDAGCQRSCGEIPDQLAETNQSDYEGRGSHAGAKRPG